jgi:hypothetical protein
VGGWVNFAKLWLTSGEVDRASKCLSTIGLWQEKFNFAGLVQKARGAG